MQKNSTKNITAPYYDSIDTMPIYNWNKIVETGDLKWLFVDGGRVSLKSVQVWYDLQDQYFKEFGVDEGFKRQLRLMKEVVLLNDQYIQSGDRFVLNLIDIAEADLKGLKKENNVRFYDLLDKVMTVKKMYIDPKKYTVIQWYYALKNISNGKTD